MALCCAPQRALFPDRPRRLDWQVLTADRGHSQERASVVTLVGLPKGGSAIRFAEDDNVEVSVPPIFSKRELVEYPGSCRAALVMDGRGRRLHTPVPSPSLHRVLLH